MDLDLKSTVFSNQMSCYGKFGLLLTRTWKELGKKKRQYVYNELQVRLVGRLPVVSSQPPVNTGLKMP